MGTIDRLSKTFLTAHPKDAAHVLEHLPAEQSAEALVDCMPAIAAGVLARMTPDTAALCLDNMPSGPAAEIVEALPIDKAVRIARLWQAEKQEEILQLLTQHTANMIRRMLQYPVGSVGSLMDPTGFSLPADISVGQALQRVQDAGQKVQYYLYIVDREHKLVGVLNLRDFILAQTEQRLESIMRDEVVKLKASALIDQIVNSTELKRFLSFPVVDGKGTFQGVLSTQVIYEAAGQGEPGRAKVGTVDTAVAIGELYWVALSGMLSGGKPPKPTSGLVPQPSVES